MQRRYRQSLTAARAEGKHLNEVIVELNQKFKWISVGLALLTSIMAGGAVSANIIPTLDAGVKQTLFMILSVLMAFASVLAFTTGEMLGMMNEEARAKIELMGVDYAAELKAWEEEREAFWRANRLSYMSRLDHNLVVEIQGRKRTVPTAQPSYAQPVRREISMPQAAEVLSWWLKKHNLDISDESISSKAIAEAAMQEAYKGTNMKPGEQEINTLAASIRMALSRERKKNGSGHTTAEID